MYTHSKPGVTPGVCAVPGQFFMTALGETIDPPDSQAKVPRAAASGYGCSKLNSTVYGLRIFTPPAARYFWTSVVLVTWMVFALEYSGPPLMAIVKLAERRNSGPSS